MPEDVLEWGTGDGRPVRERGRSWGDRVVLPPIAPYVLAGIGAVAYFVSVSQPWRVYHFQPDSNTQIASSLGFGDRHEYALTLGLGLAYTVGALVLAGLIPVVLTGSVRMKRIATGICLAMGVMCLAQLIAVVSIAGRDSVWYESSTELHQTISSETGLYAAFAAVVSLALATISTHYIGARRRPRAVEEEPEFETDAPRDLTVSAS
jgi:hypothetical protein